MKSIKSDFEKESNRNPNLSSFICLAKVVKVRFYVRKSLVKAFNQLVSKEDYATEEKNQLIDHLEYLTNMS